MIVTKKDLYDYLEYEKRLYINRDRLKYIISMFIKSPLYMNWKYVKVLRKVEFYKNNSNKILYIFYKRKLNKLGQKLGIEIKENCFGKGLKIFHGGSIIVNSKARIGENCRIVGNVCIGNNRSDGGVPKIGKNVLIGIGAIVIGDIEIADNISIAAGAVVVNSFKEEGITIGGIPARKLEIKKNNNHT